MKKQIFTFCACVAIGQWMAAQETGDLYAGGSGTRTDPYLIETEEQFDAIRENRAAYFKLMADLDFSSYVKEGGWWPLGEWGAGDGDAQRFSGTFDGNGHKISNLLARHEGDDGAHDMSIFGVVDGGTIRNLLIDNVTVVGGGRLGILSGQTRNATIEQIGVMNSSCSNIGTGSNAGGVTGPCAGTTTIINCYTVDCTISAASPHEEGAEWTGDAVGGITSSGQATIMYCYSTSTVEGKTNIGGIIGANDGATVYNCLSLNKNIVGEAEVTHRIVGKRNGGDVADNYAHSSVLVNGAPVTEDVGLSMDNGETVEELTESFYVDELYFDFDEVWTLDSNISPYPVFKWQSSTSGISEIAAESPFKVYVSGGNVRVEGLNGGETVSVYTLDGVLVEEMKAVGNEETLSLPGSGFYVVTVLANGKAESFKVLK